VPGERIRVVHERHDALFEAVEKGVRHSV
jgi:hypothetical protein